MKKKLIKPRTLKGFRDYLPNRMIVRERLIDTAREVYRSFGFAPIDTPAMEYSEILLGNGSDETDKQMFRFEDNGKRDVSLRFDLTIPFARFAAEHLNEVGTPFKRYHVGPVWRAEKPQAGRYREFVQCDFDTIGTVSNAADIETLFVIHDLFVELGFSNFTIRVNNRKVLNGLLDSLNLRDRSTEILRSLDKLTKIQAAGVKKELTESVGLSDNQAEKILSLISAEGTTDEILTQLDGLLTESDEGAQGVTDLRELFATCEVSGIPTERVELDVSIARGLNYYTGTIYETFLNDLPGIGSVCSGGRYDNLASLFTSQALPGVGASLGLDRLLAAMDELELLPSQSTTAVVLVTCFDRNHQADYLRIARQLRAAGLPTEVFPDAKNLGKQLGYASNKGFRVALIAGDNEFESGSWQIKDLAKGEQQTVSEYELICQVRELLEE